jgi:hypothetical protein
MSVVRSSQRSARPHHAGKDESGETIFAADVPHLDAYEIGAQQ